MNMSKQKHDIDTCNILRISTYNAEQTDRGRPASARSPKTTEAVPPKRLHGYATGTGEMLGGVRGDRIKLGMTSTGSGHSDPILRIEGEMDIAAAEVYVARVMRLIVEAKKNLVEHGSGPLGFGGSIRPAEMVQDEE
jgi:hypothetical protein